MAATAISFIKSLFFKKKKAPMVCAMDIAHDPNHVHTDACFVEIQPLAIAEFFQSQGCAACPDAIPLIHKAAGGNPNVLLLTYNVTYFNGRTGWTDTKANPAWDARQKSYATRMNRTTLFTPQIIMDGVADGTGRQEGDFNDVLSRAIGMRNAMTMVVGMELVGTNQVKIASEMTGTDVFDVVVISYDKAAEKVKVGKGPNKGKKMLHMNVVKDVTKIDEWAGGPKVVSYPDMSGDGLGHIMILQQGSGGMVVAACML